MPSQPNLNTTDKSFVAENDALLEVFPVSTNGTDLML